MSLVWSEEAVLTFRTQRLIGRATGDRFLQLTGVLVLLGLLMWLGWSELMSEVRSSIRDLAGSLETSDRMDRR
jgi:hypothetical protein